MAVPGMAAGDNDAIRPPLKGAQDEHRIHTAGARYPDDLNVRRIRKPARACQIGARIAAPVAAERNDQRLEFFIIFLYLHIASTSAMICLVVKPFRSIAPEGHVTVHAPQP